MQSVNRRARLALGLASAWLAVAVCGSSAWATGDAPAPTPSPSAASDPCGGPGRLLATLDRPTVGFSACTVPNGAIVLEEGYQNTFQGGGSPGVTTVYPQGFERIGVARRLELDIIGPNFNRARVGSTLANGFSDLGLGFKYELPQAGRFTYGIDGLFTAATGTGSFSSAAPTQTVNVDVSYSLSPAIGIGTTLAAQNNAGADSSGNRRRYGDFMPSLVVTAQIPNYYQFYAEVVAPTKTAPDAGGRVFTDFGIQKLVGPFLELDALYAIDFTQVGGSRFNYVGFGAGIRLK